MVTENKTTGVKKRPFHSYSKLDIVKSVLDEGKGIKLCFLVLFRQDLFLNDI